tara:strand:+ start:5670 stop:6701 length:1032 start_codon:yes stop_codon:yes gene_type:complete
MKDIKYLFAYTIPMVTAISIYAKGVFTFTTPIYAFIVIPVLELIIKERHDDFSEEELSSRKLDRFFDFLLYLNIPFVFVLLFIGLNKLSVETYTLSEYIGLVLSLGILLATNAINVAHELGHRKDLFERSLGKLLLLPCLYMHFYLEHNFGHHTYVATPEDPATSKKNQSVYHFWFSSVVGQYINAWNVQLRLLKNNKHSFISIHNDMIWYHFFQLTYLLVVAYFFGLTGLYFAIGVGVLSFIFLETINYIEHYGLERKKQANGRYERVKPHHSWNSNHLIGRIVLYELTRHSDHHFIASKKYQTLENKSESPQLPYGYPTSILISLVPPLWFGLMNKRLPKA